MCEKVGIKDKKSLSGLKDEETIKIEDYFKELEEKKTPPKPEKEKETLQKRAPVVTIMGHVDHGKTTILDAIRKSRITAQEYGQITQKIGAYKVFLPQGSIVFIDTPGHEAFTAMRARGAKVTDIVVLVVAADEGVKPQTIEAINHAKSANVPIIVAINKIDKPNINPEKIKKELSEYGLIPEEWGGDTIYVNVSGLTGQGLDELLEMILLVGEMMELKADPHKPARGTVIESQLHKSKGPVLTILVQEGTLKIGQVFVAGETWGKVRAMIDDWGKKVEKAEPSTPVEILGSNGVVPPGTKFEVVSSEKEAKQICERIKEEKKKTSASVKKLTLEDLYKELKKGQVKELRIVLKADYIGSIEAIRNAIENIPTEEVKISIIHSGTGPVTESDILLASASNGIVIGFNVSLAPKVDEIAKREGVEIKIYRVIYDLIDEIRKAIEGMLEPEEKETMLGQALVKKVFKFSRNFVVAGCLVVDGKVVRDSKVKIIRDGNIIFEGVLTSLKRFKEPVKEVPANTECGIGIENFTDFKEGDIIQSYTVVKVPRRLK
ncbi:translation initiation factor IF-2 [Candidatus Bathyarchaeota archaeon]|nr:MAG: translation initiation factor IF-2 [Candidatus Bathyarchaeota archaeon]